MKTKLKDLVRREKTLEKNEMEASNLEWTANLRSVDESLNIKRWISKRVFWTMMIPRRKKGTSFAMPIFYQVSFSDCRAAFLVRCHFLVPCN